MECSFCKKVNHGELDWWISIGKNPESHDEHGLKNYCNDCKIRDGRNGIFFISMNQKRMIPIMMRGALKWQTILPTFPAGSSLPCRTCGK